MVQQAAQGAEAEGMLIPNLLLGLVPVAFLDKDSAEVTQVLIPVVAAEVLVVPVLLQVQVLV
jgi:hypothetical protein